MTDTQCSYYGCPRIATYRCHSTASERYSCRLASHLSWAVRRLLHDAPEATVTPLILTDAATSQTPPGTNITV